MYRMRTNKVDVLLSVPSADVQEWNRGLEPTNGGTVCPSEVLPSASTTGRVARVIHPRLSPPAPDAWKGISVLETPSTDLCTSKSLKGFYGVPPTMKMMPTQPMFNISMEEMDMTVGALLLLMRGLWY